MRVISKKRENKRRRFYLTHNLKVVGSNPTPATKKYRVIKLLSTPFGAAVAFAKPVEALWKQKGAKSCGQVTVVVRDGMDAPRRYLFTRLGLQSSTTHDGHIVISIEHSHWVMNIQWNSWR